MSRLSCIRMVFVFERLLVLFPSLARVLALSVGIRGFLVGGVLNRNSLHNMGI